MKYFYQEIAKYGYIPYTTPLQFAGTGTLVGGSPKMMALIANPNTCFPGIDSGPNQLRYRDESTLPNTKEHFIVNANMTLNLFQGMQTGFPSIKAGVHINEAQTIELEFDGIHIEYIDAVKLVNFYRHEMSDVCRSYLDQVGFIVQAIVADQVRFSFFHQNGGRIELTVDKIQQLVDISVGTNWEIEQSATLVIKTPKHIGYQLGSLRSKDNGLSLSRASKVMLNKWIFQEIGVYPKDGF